jgi:hypothetical protein
VGQKKEFRSSKLESRMGAFLQNSKFEVQDSRFFSNPSDHLFPLDLSAVVAPWRAVKVSKYEPQNSVKIDK